MRNLTGCRSIQDIGLQHCRLSIADHALLTSLAASRAAESDKAGERTFVLKQLPFEIGQAPLRRGNQETRSDRPLLSVKNAFNSSANIGLLYRYP